MTALTIPQGYSWRTIFAGAPNTAGPNDTNENTLLTLTLPAYTMGPNGILRIETLWETNNNANAKTPRVKFGGTTLLTGTLASTAGFHDVRTVWNNNSNSAQRTYLHGGNGGWHTGSTAPTTMAINTAADVTILITAQLGTGTDTIKLTAYSVDVCQRP